MFGDAGALYFVLPEADLRERRFDRVDGDHAVLLSRASRNSRSTGESVSASAAR